MVLKAELQRMVAECACSRVAECRVIEALADHSRNKLLGEPHQQHRSAIGTFRTWRDI